MSAANTAKPPRPCTEYNIFFQLERAYIIQVLLHSQPSLDPSEVFRPSQASYAGLPPLPGRYAALILPYDWHLPGKEKRRRRKHRKSHGVIGFHELSARIVDAWKDADGDVRAYCAAVCAAGMARYRAAMKEWKRVNGGRPAESQKKEPPKVTREPKKAKISKDEVVVVADAEGDDTALQALLDELDFPNVARQETLVPAVAASGTVAAEEMDRAFENDLPLAWDEPAAVSADAVPSAGAAPRRPGWRKSHRTSVDMDDGEIFALWNDENAVSRPYGTPAACANDEKLNLQFHSMFGSDGYAQTMQDVRRMKELMDVEAQIAKLQRMVGRPRPRRRSTVARSA